MRSIPQRMALAARAASRSRRRSRLIAPLVAAVGLVAACRPAAQYEAVATADLTARLAVATVSTETGAVNFGTPEARRHLLTGWSRDFVDGNDRSLVRSVGEESSLRFLLFEPRSLTLRFRCRPREGLRSISGLEILVNASPVSFVELEPRLRTYDVSLSADLLVQGDNVLTFRYAFDGPRRETSPEETDLTSVTWFALELAGTGAALEPPVADPARDVLFIPYGNRAAFPLVAGPESAFIAEWLDFRGGREPALEITLLTDAGETEIARLDPTQEPVPVELSTERPEPVFLALRAESKGDWSAGDGVYMRQPHIRDPVLTSPPVTTSTASRPNILVYLVDTLRADHLATYGYERPTSPRLDEFAANATVFEKAIGQSSWTRPSVASLFTAQWPVSHAVIKRRDALSTEAETLAELLRANDFVTIGFSTNPNISEPFGFAQGFDEFELLPREYDSERTNDKVFEWLASRPTAAPFFLYVHTADPHAPYLPPEPFRSRFAADAAEVAAEIESNPEKEIWSGEPEETRRLLDLFDGEIAANDASFGALLDRFRELDLYDDTLVVFLSDHGEEFHDHGGWTHGRDLYAETLDVPLVIKLPGQRRGGRVAEIAQHIDLLPTVLELLAIEPPARSEGRSLLPLMSQPTDGSPGSRPGYSHVSLVRGVTTSVIAGEWKLITRQRRGKQTTRLYRWPRDPQERHDLASEFPVRTRALLALLEEKLTSPGAGLSGEEAQLDHELEQRLKALGYL